MKKTLVSAITAALVVGAASTTFAAANPFSDVPADSWAYNAVVTLANDGVIDGFPNGTFQGNKNMTRYEMAQIIARAMAKENMSKADKALVEKLAVEFASELNNLGVRVSNLETKSDNVKLTGEVRYRYINTNIKELSGELQKSKSEILFRLNPQADLGNGWKAHARLDANLNAAQDQDKSNVEVDRVYVEGPLLGTTVTAGKLPAVLANGLVFDGTLSGVKVATTKGNFDLTGVAGRYNREQIIPFPHEEKTSELYAGQLGYKVNDNVKLHAGYATLNNIFVVPNHKIDGAALYAGIEANVDKNVKLTGEYAKLQKEAKKIGDLSGKKINNSYSVELGYKAANPMDQGSWGAYVGYRRLGLASLKATYDDAIKQSRGVAYGVEYVPATNVLATVKYFDGRSIFDNKHKISNVFGQLEFLF